MKYIYFIYQVLFSANKVKTSQYKGVKIHSLMKVQREFDIQNIN